MKIEDYAELNVIVKLIHYIKFNCDENELLEILCSPITNKILSKSSTDLKKIATEQYKLKPQNEEHLLKDNLDAYNQVKKHIKMYARHENPSEDDKKNIITIFSYPYTIDETTFDSLLSSFLYEE
jgi:hypothetical protein